MFFDSRRDDVFVEPVDLMDVADIIFILPPALSWSGTGTGWSGSVLLEILGFCRYNRAQL